MTPHILWVDNDPAYLDPYIDALREAGVNLTVVMTAWEAEAELQKRRYDLLILDVMIPTKTEREEEIYNPEETEHGLKTGLVFYRRNKEILMKTNTQLLVFTVRLDRLILDEFIDEGLAPECFKTKMDLREVPVFIEIVRGLLGEANR